MSVTRHRKHETGQGLVEYSLILSLVAVVAIVALALVGGEIRGEFCKILDTVSDEDLPDFCNVIEIEGEPVYEAIFQTVTIRATIGGGYDPNVAITVESPNAPTTPMTRNGDAYEASISLNSACPCVFTLRSDDGNLTTVNVGF